MIHNKRIKTSRNDVYRNLVTGTAVREDEIDSKDENEGYPFDTNYELFLAGLVVGFVKDEAISQPEKGYGQDFIQVNRIGSSPENEYRQGVKFIIKLVEAENPELEEDELWDLVLRYADAGVGQIYQDFTTYERLDFNGTLKSCEEKWPERLEEVLGDFEAS